MDYQIKKINTQIRDTSGKTVPDRQLEERIQLSMRTVEKLENQLDVAIKKFNSVLADNDKIREEIDHLIKERAHFNSLWNKMVINLTKGKKFMMDLVEQATMSYDQRDEWCGKLEALKERGKADLLQHTQEMRELQRNLDHDNKLKEYLSIKGQKRVMQDLNVHEEEKRQARRDEMEKHLHEYQRIFDEIKAFAQEDNIERLASQFIKQEEENFALFKYVNELNFELETLNDSVDDYRKKIEVQREINEQRANQQKIRMLQLAEELEEAKNHVEESEKKLEDFQEKLKRTLEEIQKIFQMVKADNSPILELLGDNASVNIFNVRLYLEILEKRTNELIQVSYYKDKMMKDESGTPTRRRHSRRHSAGFIKLIHEPCGHKCKVTNIDKIVLNQPCPLCVEREIVSDVIEELQVPDNRQEIQERLRIRLGLPDAEDRLHNVSACKLPASRVLLQKRYA
ncbi:coiled-coil domain-containing protein 63-like [Chrysoperla carnea]|uniref:coiled-coil domain-containing protein 63-like n=1 Tax=Chrysoperla carnea TaxID=189513 RepID=UPI001D072165|nr:coiled-coil domain-containing protein 63-like [Chrysoperla carnea]